METKPLLKAHYKCEKPGPVRCIMGVDYMQKTGCAKITASRKTKEDTLPPFKLPEAALKQVREWREEMAAGDEAEEFARNCEKAAERQEREEARAENKELHGKTHAALANIPTRDEVEQLERRLTDAISAGSAARFQIPEDRQNRDAAKKAMQLSVKEINKVNRRDEQRKHVGRTCKDKAGGTLYEVVGKTEGRGLSDFYVLMDKAELEKYKEAAKAAARSGPSAQPQQPQKKLVSEKEFREGFVFEDPFYVGVKVTAPRPQPRTRPTEPGLSGWWRAQSPQPPA